MLSEGRGLAMRKQTVKFGVFTDLHLEIMHDGERRLTEFLDRMKKEDVDFIIQLGDFCYPKQPKCCLCSEEKMPVNLKNAMIFPPTAPKERMRDLYNNFEKPHFYVLGNHEQDFCSKEEAMAFYGMSSRYYSFQVGEWKMIVLDASNFKTSEGRIKAYDHGDYFDSTDLPYIDEEQMQWLEKELMDSEGPAVVFSHQPLNKSPRGIRNAEQLSELFQKASQSGCRVHLCMNGHTHVDLYQKWNGVGYYTLNSMSNHWIGTEYACRRFDEETEQEFPNLQYTFPYEEALYGIVTLTKEGGRVEGVKGEFVAPIPEKTGLKPGTVQGLSAGIQDREFQWDQ